jgi:hypothetical protein
MAMAQVQVLHDVLQSGIRWRVTLYCDSAAAALVRFEKTGKGGRLLHQQLARWSPLYGAGFILPRDQVAGGLMPNYLVEHIEAVLRGSPLPAKRSERQQVRRPFMAHSHQSRRSYLQWLGSQALVDLSDCCCFRSLPRLGELVDQILFERQLAQPPLPLDPKILEVLPY